VRGDVAELTEGSIYRKQERRPGILAVTRGGQRKKKSTGARESLASTVAVTPMSHGEAQGFTTMRWRGSSTWHTAGRRLSPVNLSATAAKHGGGGGYGGESPELYRGAGLLPGGLIGSSAT
jgi:hypothetical protein